MKPEQNIVVIIKKTGDQDALAILTESFDNRADAFRFALNHLGTEDVPLIVFRETLRQLCIEKGRGVLEIPAEDGRESSFTVSFTHIPGDGSVSDEDLYHALDGYLNTGRERKAYEDFAGPALSRMHRAVQDSLWKFLKTLTRAIAAGGYDLRNKTAHLQAEQVTGFMDSQKMS